MHYHCTVHRAVQAKAELEIDDYAVSQSTLEQIFILMAKQQDSDYTGE